MSDLYDCCTKRLDVSALYFLTTAINILFTILQTSSYNTRQWYEGEPVKCTYKSLENAEWLPSYKPSDAYLKKMDNSNRKMKFTVLKVKCSLLTVLAILCMVRTN